MFIPPHCSNPKCTCYNQPDSRRWYQRIGFYSTRTFGKVRRYRCKSCGISFSDQTFSIDYYAKRKVDYQDIYNKINAGSGIRNIARDLQIKDSTVTNRINRMARNAVLINQMIVDQLPFNEDLVLDGLQNFCVSQYFPDNYTILVGKDSQFVYDCDYATLRRCGQMTSRQKIRREELEKRFKRPSRVIEKSFGRLLNVIHRNRTGEAIPLILYTDEKKDYQRAFWRTLKYREKMFSGQWRHHQTNSKDGRNQKNPLFAANYIDREIRKDMASQARETVQFPRNVANAMLRMNLYLFDHNVRKPYRIVSTEKRKLRHAQVAGLDRGLLDSLISDFFKYRNFMPGSLTISDSASRTLGRKWITPLSRKEEMIRKYLMV